MTTTRLEDAKFDAATARIIARALQLAPDDLAWAVDRHLDAEGRGQDFDRSGLCRHLTKSGGFCGLIAVEWTGMCHRHAETYFGDACSVARAQLQRDGRSSALLDLAAALDGHGCLEHLMALPPIREYVAAEIKRRTAAQWGGVDDDCN